MSDLFAQPCTTTFDLRAGDCLAGMAALPAESVDVVVTSPPYNLDIAYASYRDNAPREEYLDWSYRWAAEVARVLKPDGSFFLNVGASPANPLLPHEIVLKLQPLFRLQNTLHWIKSITVRPRREAELSVGHFKPINSKRFLTDCHEYVFHLTKSGRVPLDRLAVGVEYADKSNIARWAHTRGEARDRRCRGNNWFIPYETIKSRAADLPRATRRVVHQTSRPAPRPRHARPLSRHRPQRHCRRRMWGGKIHRLRDGRRLFRGGAGAAHAGAVREGERPRPCACWGRVICVTADLEG